MTQDDFGDEPNLEHFKFQSVLWAGSQASGDSITPPALSGAPYPVPDQPYDPSPAATGQTQITEGSFEPRAAISPPLNLADAQSGDWSVGDLVAGRYCVHRVVVSGMGTVYLCYDQQAREPVAIKTYRNHSGIRTDEVPARDGRALAQMFEAEAMVWVRLGDHPHIVHAKYVLRIGARPYVFLEYVTGPAGEESTVRRLIQPGGTAPEAALRVAIQVCVGMEHAVTVFPGLVHRDLKPENLLLSAEGVVKITDFGLTRVFADFTNRVGTIAGTPPYMSPEQALGLPRLDTRSDIFSLGVIVYELLTGCLPAFAGPTNVEAFRARLADVAVPPDELVESLPPSVCAVVIRCLAKRPEDRFASFTELKDALIECYREMTGHEPALPSTVDSASALPSAQASIELARALSLAALGRQEEALALFDLAVEHDPELARAWVCKGVALAGLGRFADSLTCLDRALDLDPGDLETWLEKARVLACLGKRVKALECFDRALAINPWNAATLHEKGASLFFLGRLEEAHVCFEEVARLEPGIAVDAARLASDVNRSRLEELSGQLSVGWDLGGNSHSVEGSQGPGGPLT